MASIGIDRILCKNLNIEQVNIKKLKEKGFVVIQDNSKCIRIIKDIETGQEVEINYIKVSRNQDKSLIINELRIGRMELNTNVLNHVDYEHLDITLPEGIYENISNENNISTSKELGQAIHNIENELEGLGFGKVDILNTELKKIEININIDLENEFKEYERILTYLQGLVPKRIKRDISSNYKANEIYTGFKTSNKSISLKMYDKRANLLRKTGQDIGKEKLRIEYTLLNEQKIKTVFGSNKLKDIVANDFILIDKTFRKLLESDLINRIYKDIDKQIKKAIKGIRAAKKSSRMLASQKYIFDYELLDIEIVFAALRVTESKNHYAREVKKIISRTSKGKNKKLFSNINKLNEILRGLGYQEIKIDMTKHTRKLVSKYY